MEVKTSNEGNEVVVRMSRVIAQPKGKDLGQQFARRLSRVRKHKRKWSAPADATLILDMHWAVHSMQRGNHTAEMTIEIPRKHGLDYYTVSRSGKTRHAALRLVIEAMENSEWFHMFKAQGVYFKVTGCEMEEVYRGYL